MHLFPNNKRYIGITKQNVSRRWRGNGQGYKKSPLMWKAIQKYGWENVRHEILFNSLNKEEAEQKEIELIAKYKTNTKQYGYNIENGGKTIGTVNEETKQKIRKAILGKKASKETIEKLKIAQQKVRKREKENGIVRKMPRGAENHMFGKHHTEEAKQKIREKNSGINSAWWGRKHTKEEIEKIAKAHKKQIMQLNDNKKILNIYDSVLDAAKTLKCKPNSIYTSLRRNSRAFGYYWKYKEVNNE